MISCWPCSTSHTGPCPPPLSSQAPVATPPSPCTCAGHPRPGGAATVVGVGPLDVLVHSVLSSNLLCILFRPLVPSHAAVGRDLQDGDVPRRGPAGCSPAGARAGSASAGVVPQSPYRSCGSGSGCPCIWWSCRPSWAWCPLGLAAGLACGVAWCRAVAMELSPGWWCLWGPVL